jgi:hypothetical protein
MLAFLTDTWIFQRCVNRYIRPQLLSFFMGFTLLNTSNMLKYLPGTVWGYTAQIVWFAKKGVPIASVVYLNALCSLTAILTSLLIGSACSLYYAATLGNKVMWLFLFFLILDVLFLALGSRFMHLFFRYLYIFFKKEFHILPIASSFLFSLHLVYLSQWFFLGLGGYFALRGIGLEPAFSHIYAIIFSLALSWVIGYLTIVAPGGIGVRESVMYAILQHITDVPTSLMLPIVMRLLYLLVDVCLGVLGSSLAMKWRIFAQTPTGLAQEARLEAQGV